MDWIEGLKQLDLSSNKYSQYGEEVIIQEIFKQIGTKSKYYVDLGAGLGISNTRLLKEQGWQGLAFDMNGGEGIITDFIQPDTIEESLLAWRCPKEFDFLSIDLDSCDYDVLLEILPFRIPRVICAEFNGTLSGSIKLKYEEGYVWDGTNKYGFSFDAGRKLLECLGYSIILNHKDTNMFAIHDPLKKYLSTVATPIPNIYHPINPSAIWEQV